jgi:exodeoxyribonuclease V alpha subunit
MPLLRPLPIVRGGPGTGKTATVVSLLACLLEQQPTCRIALTAPTGKAAARMLEAIRSRAHDLAPQVAARVPTDAFTIHRLLGVSRTGDTFRHHAGHPLPLDVLVVDEASMLDLALAARLLEAVPDGAKVVLLGDKDQLAAVETGAVFAEISADPSLSEALAERLAAVTGIAAAAIAPAPTRAASALRDCVVWLVENFRFGLESGIGRLAALVNAGDADAAMAWLRASGDESVSWIEDAGRAPAPATMARIEEGYRPYVDALRAGRTPEAVFDAFDRYRVLCAEREGPRGVAGMNDAIAAWFRAALDHPLDPGGRSPWYPGRPVMLLGNDYALRLFNGDIGIVLPARDGALQVVFRDAAGELRHVPPGRLPAHETAFASTVHKAQGNEHDAVVLVLPARASAVVGRALLYTGVTRARVRCTITSSADVLGEAIRAVSARRTGLQARWAGLAAG